MLYTHSIGSVLLLSWLVFWYFFFYAIPARYQHPHSETSSRREFTFLCCLTLLFVVMHGLVLWNVRNTPVTYDYFNVSVIALGFVATISGQMLMLSARHALAGITNFDLLFRLTKERIHTGPYQYISWPVYGGLVLSHIGSSLLLLSAEGVFFVLCFIVPVLFLRARIEPR